MEFQNPYYLLLLLLLVPYVAWYVLRYSGTTPSIRVSTTTAYAHLPRTWRVWLTHAPFLLNIIIFASAVLALARPQTSNSWSNRNVEGIDIMLCMDISTSMLSEDLKPNRVQAARNVALEFISSRPDDNIGLTVFAGEAYTQCPMTTDHAVLVNLLSGLDCNMVMNGMLEDGTAIGMGLANAVTRLKDSKAKSKVIILLTDGTNNRGDISPNMAADIAKSFGIRVYTVAVGTNGTAPYPMIVGGRREYINIPVEIDTKTLSQIATTTGGDTYRATNTRRLHQVYQEIDKLEKTKFSVKKYSKRYEAYQMYAIIAVIASLVEILLRATLLKRIP
ncbi:MAG: VWA domain-containing protein [Bacteroidaceae bacterium]|nr:VWA domain-containing protein [Bacteroidaceae bacterium]